MEVVRATSAGACYGVKRALDMAHACASEETAAHTLGPLIHNPRVVAELDKRGIGVVDDPAQADGEAIILRSHGVTPETLRSAQATGLRIVDATCPHVSRAQQAAVDMAREGRTVIVVGEDSHPEVKGLRAWAEDVGGHVVVVGPGQALPDDVREPVGVVVQTTQTQQALDDVLDALNERGIEPKVAHTICNATTKRQQAAIELAATVDAMVIVGGKNSSNTKHLYELCAALCPKSFHVETADELDAADFAGCTRIGVSAGASTPEEHIVAVEDCLRGW